MRGNTFRVRVAARARLAGWEWKRSRSNRIPEAIFSYRNCNAVHDEKRFSMPLAQVVEIGTQIDI
jgi:hypothetical protein